MSKGVKKLAGKRKREQPPALPDGIEIEQSEGEPVKKSKKIQRTGNEVKVVDNSTKRRSKGLDEAEELIATNGEVEQDATNSNVDGQQNGTTPAIKPAKKSRIKKQKPQANGLAGTEDSAVDHSNEGQDNYQGGDMEDGSDAGSKKKHRFIVFVGTSSPQNFTPENSQSMTRCFSSPPFLPH